MPQKVNKKENQKTLFDHEKDFSYPLMPNETRRCKLQKPTQGASTNRIETFLNKKAIHMPSDCVLDLSNIISKT